MIKFSTSDIQRISSIVNDDGKSTNKKHTQTFKDKESNVNMNGQVDEPSLQLSKILSNTTTPHNEIDYKP